MGIDRADARIESGIGDTPQPDASVVVGNILDEILDRIVGVGALIYIVRLQGIDEERAIIDEDAFRFAHTAYILIGKDVAVVDELARATRTVSIRVRSVWASAIGRTFQEDGMLTGLI